MNLPTHLGDQLALTNAILNGTSGVLVTLGWLSIRPGARAGARAPRPETHRRFMLSALAVSAVFLVSYLTRIAISGTHHYPGHGVLRAAYLLILVTHVTLAIVTVPLVLSAVAYALKRRFAKHRAVVAWALPIWLYVSVTGVVVYVMLYQALPAS